MGCGIEPRKIRYRRGREFLLARRQHVRHRYARCRRPAGVQGHITCKRMRAAYDALPANMKEKLSTLVGLHGRSSGPGGEKLYGDDKGRTEKVYHEMPRAAVIKHPASGRPILFVNPMHTHGFVGMEREEAWPLIEELSAHATQDRFVYYHHWRVGDLLMWDELATMHRGAGDYRPEERRVMLRTIVYAN